MALPFGRESSWYEADRMAMAFSGPDLPVPQGGRFLEDTPVERADAVAPTLTRLLVALYRVPASPGTR